MVTFDSIESVSDTELVRFIVGKRYECFDLPRLQGYILSQLGVYGKDGGNCTKVDLDHFKSQCAIYGAKYPGALSDGFLAMGAMFAIANMSFKYPLSHNLNPTLHAYKIVDSGDIFNDKTLLHLRPVEDGALPSHEVFDLVDDEDNATVRLQSTAPPRISLQDREDAKKMPSKRMYKTKLWFTAAECTALKEARQSGGGRAGGTTRRRKCPPIPASHPSIRAGSIREGVDGRLWHAASRASGRYWKRK